MAFHTTGPRYYNVNLYAFLTILMALDERAVYSLCARVTAFNKTNSNNNNNINHLFASHLQQFIK